MSSWEKLKDYFEEDDGFLPEIAVEGYKDEEIVEVFNSLLEISSKDSLESELWHIATESNKKLYSFKCAAEMVLKGEAEPFHMLFKQPIYQGVQLPDLGAYIAPDEIILDYRRGHEWSEVTLNALLALVKNIMLLREGIVVEHQECSDLFNGEIEAINNAL